MLALTIPAPLILLPQLCRLHPVLVEIVCDTLRAIEEATGLDYAAVSRGGIYRPADAANPARSGVHAAPAPHRAIDLAARTWDDVRAVGALVNPLWIYDPRRPRLNVLATHEHGTGPHYHLQVHPRTIRTADLRDDDDDTVTA